MSVFASNKGMSVWRDVVFVNVCHVVLMSMELWF